MKRLSWYILKEHFAPFLFAFFTITFLLVIEYAPKIITNIIDKDLSMIVGLELVALNLAWMLALSVPMSALVATLMAFGRLNSDFEIVAIKAGGINLIRLLIPVLGAGLILTFVMIQFNDKVLPDLNKQARELWGDIRSMRPTLVFKSGIFVSDIPGYLVLVEDIDHKTSRVEGVTITETRNPSKPRIVVSEYGFLKMMDRGQTMQFTLYNGEIYSLDISDPENYRQVEFDTHVINVSGDKSSLRRSSSDYRTDREMNIDRMRLEVSKSEKTMRPAQKKIGDNLNSKFDFLFSDSLELFLSENTSDSLANSSLRREARLLSQFTSRHSKQIASLKRTISSYDIEIYKKYSIPAASLAFILIGAPLAMMSKKSGMGSAIAISIGLFVVYWAFLIGGEDLGNRGIIPAFWAMWSANILVGGIGLWLIYLVTGERRMFEWFIFKRVKDDSKKN